MACHASAQPYHPKNETADIIALFGSWGAECYEHAELKKWLKHHARTRATLMGVELGVYAFAQAGLLFKSHVTTHWCWKSGFEERFPRLDVCEQLYCIDKNIITCAGAWQG